MKNLRISMGPMCGTFEAILRNMSSAIVALVVAFFLGSDIYALYVNYSPVPFTDSWLGTVGFYLKTQEAPLAFWTQHNEHRIPISKLLFWLDMRYLDGSTLLLLPVNIALLLATWAGLWAMANRLVGFTSARQKFGVAMALGMIALAWMQHQNIIGPFQSMFTMAFLLPLLSFYCFARVLDAPADGRRWYLCSLLFAVASQYCLLNGLAVLPILALFSAFGERSPRRCVAILLFALASFAVFLVDYEIRAGSTSGLQALAQYPIHLIRFALVYLGGPFYLIFHRMDVAVAAGVLAVLLTMYLFLTRSRYRSKPYALSLFAYIAYVFVAAAMTTLGRYFLGLEFAVSSRYLTPTLIMWAALILLLLGRAERVDRWSWAVVAATVTLLLPAQLPALKLDTTMSTPQVKAVAALGLQLGINDIGAKKLVLSLFYDDEVEEVFNDARRAGVSIFSDRYAYPARYMGHPLSEASGAPCSARVDIRIPVDAPRDAYRVGGVLAVHRPGSVRYILFSDEHGVVKGIAFPGRDMQQQTGPPGEANFDGYFLGGTDFREARCISRRSRWPVPREFWGEAR